MTAAILCLMVIAQVTDLVLWSTAPHLEANPIMAAGEPWMVVAAKVAGIVAVGSGSVVLARRGYVTLGKALLVATAAVGILGSLSAVITLRSDLMDPILLLAASIVILAAVILTVIRDPDRLDAERRNRKK